MHKLDKKASILLVDDSPAILALLKDLLAAHGFRDIRTAESAKDGLDAVAERHPDIVFLDLLMPDSSGIEFARSALRESPDSRIVVTTALPPNHEAVTMAVSQGATEYLQKPLREEAVSNVLEHLTRHDDSAADHVIGYG